ncbi:DUF1156 domain-containing protein [Stygiolobus caldivivus]|uniref:DUF1156 domain-containing protein n=1 Tax=Stygiolobus caldivivus TaxID=2824673 RepID=A0A8D5ZF56_9CREN|nr:DUF1156 domain-containing protein [Stygiolobus caldivivus]BCU70063.1 hypothetical protein KN1_13600 [Stygiolobus caldivivus]
MDRLFIQSDSFSLLLPEIDRKAAKEKGPARPSYWEMVYWWGRDPLISARAFLAASLLPEDFKLEEFRKIIRLDKEVPHRYNPDTAPFRNYTFLDPFGSFGTIPLEAKRLGLKKVITTEPIPTAFTFLKAIVDYPKYGEKLLNDVQKYGKELVESIREEVKDLYQGNAGFVGTWEVKCPVCGNYTPLVYSWWLLALRSGGGTEGSGMGSGTYTRLAFMHPVKEKDRIRIKVVDINRELGKDKVKARVTKNKVIVHDPYKTYEVDEGNVKVNNRYARCLYCGFVMSGEKDEWYVRDAIREWNRNYEKFLEGEISLEDLRGSKGRPVLLVKFKGKGKDLEFEEITHEDEENFWRAFQKLKYISLTELPTEPLPPVSIFGVYSWGVDKFYKLFNARQLIVHTKLLHEINELRNRIEGEEEYKEAVVTYFTMVLLEHIRYNSFLTLVQPTRSFIASGVSVRGNTMSWNWVEISPLSNVTGSLYKLFEHLKKGLEYLIGTNTTSEVKVVPLNRVDIRDLNTEKVDLMATSVPFADDRPYLSDYFYVWLKRVLPFPYNTQWEEFAPKNTTKRYKSVIGTLKYFREKMADDFLKFYELLKDDGTLVTFYVHSTTDSWVSLLYAGWYRAKFRVISAHAITTKAKTRMATILNTIALDKSLVITWKKRAEGSKLLQDVKNEAISEVSSWFSNFIRVAPLSADTYVEVLGRVLSIFTKYEKLIGLEGKEDKAVENLVRYHLYPTTTQAIIEGLGKIAGIRISDPYSSFYILTKVLVPPVKNSARKIDRESLALLNFTGSLDEGDLEKNEIITIERNKKRITLNEPENVDGLDNMIRAFEKLEYIKEAKLGKYEFKNAVQLFHYLEYIALKSPDRLKAVADSLRERSTLVKDALTLAKVLSTVLGNNDIEKETSKRIIQYLGY